MFKVGLVVFVLGALYLTYNAVLSKRHYEEPVNFYVTVKSRDFVDKTLFVKTVFEMPEKIMITVPPRSGRSTNLDMLKKFLEIQVNEYGDPVTKMGRFKRPVNNTSNYNLFFANRLKITKHEKFMRRHFGKYPVLFIDFKCRENKITNSENAVYCFIESIHNTFFQHRYLIKSEVLTTKERRYVKKWCDSYTAYEKFFGQDVTNSLYKLAILLYKHFGQRKVVAIIDNYDFPSTSAMYEVKDGQELNRVIRFNMGILRKLMSADYRYLGRTILVGVSYIAAAGIYQLDDLQVYRFLEDHSFVQYFGLTELEVESLFQKTELNNSEILSFARASYGGFVSKHGKKVYNLGSVLKFLHHGEVRNYCLLSGLVQNLHRLFKIPIIREHVESLVKNGSVSLDMSNVITVNDIMNLRDAVLNVRTQEHFNINLVLYFLHEQGYLTYSFKRNDQSNETELKLPNTETKTTFALQLKEYYDRTHRLDKTLVKKCASFFERFSQSLITNKVNLKRALYWFFKSLDDLIHLNKNRFSKPSMTDVYRLLFSVVYEVRNKGSSVFIEIDGIDGELSFDLVKDNFNFILGLRLNTTSSYALQELLEREVNIVENDHKARKKIFIGVGVDNEINLSVSCRANSKNASDYVHIPEVYDKY